MTPTLYQQLLCARRELGLRHRVYPGLVHRGKLTQEKARFEIDAMTAIAATFQQLCEAEGTDFQQPLFPGECP